MIIHYFNLNYSIHLVILCLNQNRRLNLLKIKTYVYFFLPSSKEQLCQKLHITLLDAVPNKTDIIYIILMKSWNTSWEMSFESHSQNNVGDLKTIFLSCFHLHSLYFKRGILSLITQKPEFFSLPISIWHNMIARHSEKRYSLF